MATLTIPEDDLWVNLSPYEKNRIISDKFGVTEMGRDLLAQDYVLKQLTASLIYPEKELGKEFWDKVYTKVGQLYGTTNLPVNTFNKVWIVPDKAVIYESGDTAFIVASHLKVMLERDYLALKKNLENTKLGVNDLDADKAQKINDALSAIIKEVVLPEIEKEVNTGTNFTSLRQVYNSMILATWFKRNLKESFLGKVYMGENKIAGVDVEDKQVKEKIYQQYLKAFKKGVYNYIKEDYDPVTQEVVPRKYFSGGMEFTAKAVDKALSVEHRSEQEAVTEVARTTDGELKTASAILNPVRDDGTGVLSNIKNGLAIDADDYGDFILLKHLIGLARGLSSDNVIVEQLASNILNNLRNSTVSANRWLKTVRVIREDSHFNQVLRLIAAVVSNNQDLLQETGNLSSEVVDNLLGKLGEFSLEKADAMIKTIGREAEYRPAYELLRLNTEKREVESVENDFAIAGDNLGGQNRTSHEDYHRQGQFSEIISDIASQIGASVRSDGLYDLRSVVANASDRRITTSHGEIYLTEDGILVIIDSRFQRDHAGRGERAIYARNTSKVKHELVELKGWIEFAVKKGLVHEEEVLKGQVDLGRILRNYMNGVGENLTSEQLGRRRQEMFQHRDKLHQQGLDAERGSQEQAPHQKYAVIIYADKKTDWNGALSGLLDLRDELEGRGYTVRNTRVDSVDSLVDRVDAYTSSRPADLLVIGAHGMQQSMHLGDGADGHLTLQNVHKLKRIKSRLAEGGSIVLQSCSTARGEGFEGNMANAFSEIFSQAERVLAPRVPAGPRFVYNAENQVSGIKYDNHEGAGVVTSINLRTNETNLTERGYDAVTGRRLARQIMETIDQADLDFIISSDGNETPRNANGIVIKSDATIEKAALIEAVLDQRESFVNLGKSELAYVKGIVSGLLKQLDAIQVDNDAKRLLLKDLREALDAFIAGKNKIQLFDVPVAFTSSKNPVLTVAYEEEGVGHIVLFNQLLNLNTNRGRQDRIIERIIIRHVLDFVGKKRVEAILGSREDLVDRLFPKASYEEEILFDLVDKYDPDKMRMAFQGLLSANDSLSGQVMAGTYHQLKEEFLRKNSQHGSRVPIVASTGEQIGHIELNRDGDIIKISLNNSQYPPSYAYDDRFIKNRQRMLSEISKDPFVALFLLNQLMFLQDSLSRIPVDKRQSVQFSFDVFQGSNMLQNEALGGAHPEYGVLIAVNRRKELRQASDDGTFAHEFHHVLANNENDSVGSVTKNIGYRDPFNEFIRAVEHPINAESFETVQEFIGYARTHKENPVEAFIAAKAQEYSIDPARIPAEIRLALEDMLLVARLTKRWIGDIVEEYAKKNNLQWHSSDRSYALNPHEWAAQRAAYYLTLERQSLIEIYADAGIEASFLSDQDISYFRQKYGEVSYWNYYHMRAKAGLTVPYSLAEIESQLKESNQDNRSYTMPTMEEVVGRIGDERIRKNLEGVLKQIKPVQEMPSHKTDDAMTPSVKKELDVGGIDLNPALLNLKTMGKGFNFNMPDPQSIRNIHIEGFSPVIFQIVPTNLPLFISKNGNESERLAMTQ